MNLMTITLVAVGLALVAGGVYALWRLSEERKAEDRRFEQRMQAQLGPPVWPAPKGPKGFSRRVGR